ncbi:hypothetical protein Q1695_005009 [Nippostrongylus brasiliensis]|nr:hypothetical protein Q1695_005009 [Nippostrongylus brasiliensis]
MAATSEPESHLADHINSCIPFYDLIEKNVREGVGNRSTTLTSQTLVAAYAFRDYSVVTNDLEGAYGKRKFCRYLDINFNEIGKPVESFIFPDFVVFCCRNPEAVYMSITDDTDSGFEDTVRILDRTIEEPIYELSICLGTLRDGTSYWLMLAELIEHHKLVGVQHFYIYVKDIDEYSEKILQDYVRTGEAEAIYFRQESDRFSQQWHFVSIQDCIHRSRHHSRYSILIDLDERILPLTDTPLLDLISKHMTQDPKVADLWILPRNVLRYGSPPSTYQGPNALRAQLPMLIFHNTSQPTETRKCVVDPKKVLVMAIHNAQLYFPGFDHGITISSKEIVIRHYRDVTIDDWSVRVLPFVEKFGVFENTTYPERLAGKLLHNVQQRLDRVYGNDRFAIASLEAV